MRFAIEAASDSHDLVPGRRYSIRSHRALWPPAVRTAAPFIWIGSTTGPTVTQMPASGIVRGTRRTGTVTVSSAPQPASRSPSVTTVEPDSTLRLTLGPMFADSDTRIASVPRGTALRPWQLTTSPRRMNATGGVGRDAVRPGDGGQRRA